MIPSCQLTTQNVTTFIHWHGATPAYAGQCMCNCHKITGVVMGIWRRQLDGVVEAIGRAGNSDLMAAIGRGGNGDRTGQQRPSNGGNSRGGNGAAVSSCCWITSLLTTLVIQKNDVNRKSMGTQYLYGPCVCLYATATKWCRIRGSASIIVNIVTLFSSNIDKYGINGKVTAPSTLRQLSFVDYRTSRIM